MYYLEWKTKQNKTSITLSPHPQPQEIQYPEKSLLVQDFLTLDSLTLVLTSLWKVFYRGKPITFALVLTLPGLQWVPAPFVHGLLLCRAPFPFPGSQGSRSYASSPSMLPSSSSCSCLTVCPARYLSWDYSSSLLTPSHSELIHFHSFNYQFMWELPELYFQALTFMAYCLFSCPQRYLFPLHSYFPSLLDIRQAFSTILFPLECKFRSSKTELVSSPTALSLLSHPFPDLPTASFILQFPRLTASQVPLDKRSSAGVEAAIRPGTKSCYLLLMCSKPLIGLDIVISPHWFGHWATTLVRTLSS